MYEKEREEVVKFGRKISEYHLTPGTTGNLSVCNREAGVFVISPSGMDYMETRPEDVVILDLQTAKIVGGERKPSSEWAMHQAIFLAKPKANAIVHTHSMYCTTLACLGESLKAVHYALASAGAPEVKVAEYATYGTLELSKNAVAAMGEANAALLANHGVIACAADLAGAFGLIESLEYVAELQVRAESVGKPFILDDAEMARVIEKFKGYGQKKA